MHDDERDKSFERLDESKPERNERSFFDWMRGKEETEESDEEKLRNKLDEELKEAARKRATDFEEERRAEEAREVAETRKLKKRWRARLVEKSQAMLEQAAERGNNPTSGYEIAKLMVAERIVQYHNALMDQTLDLRRSEIKDLKLKIDFMGLLSEKLDRPRLEVPEEIEQLYQTIAASVEEATGEHLEHSETSETDPEAPPVSPEDAEYTRFAANIVTAIKRALQPTPQPFSPSPSGGGETSPTMPERENKGNDETLEALRRVVRRTAPPTRFIREELFQAETSQHVSDIVEKVALSEVTNSREPSAIAVAGLVRRESVENHEQLPEKTGTREATSEFRLPPNRKIKHLSEIELVALAKLVDVGAGQRLADVYRTGDIDREGLVKVLESYHKGWDYRSEFTRRRETWRRHNNDSQEYLTQPTPTTPQPTTPPDENQSERLQSAEVPPVVLRKKPYPIRQLLQQTKGRLRNIGDALPNRERAKELLKHAAVAPMRRDYVMTTLIGLLILALLLFIAVELNLT